MELKKKDFILVTVLDGQRVLALRPDYFDDKAPIGEPLNKEEVAEALAEAVEAVAEAIVETMPVPTPEELAEIEKKNKIAELEAALAEAKGE